MAKILIVDDDPHIRTIFMARSQQKGYDITEAHTGAQAIKIMESDEHFDLILLDQALPDMDGLEIMGIMQEKNIESPPIIMLTAHSSVPLVVAFLKAGGSDYLEKPIDFEVLDLKISKYIKSAAVK